jgi:alpha-mannosidase
MKKKPTVHLICNAHLDPVWQWRWEEGASEAMATFRIAADILNERPELVFCHNEAVLYRWVEWLDPLLFREIRRLVRAGRWAISGGWYLQPDANLPGIESTIRQIAEGRAYLGEKFGVVPRVAYNFDSFGHGAGLPQVLRQAGYEMYIHMRPQAHEMDLPSDLYRWRGADGSEVLAYRIAVGLYHTEYDNIEDRLAKGIALALEQGCDVPVFWGIGDHGGGPTRRDLDVIERVRRDERRVAILHSTPERLYDALKTAGRKAPVVRGDLQRCFTGCYTSLSRLKRRAVQSLGLMTQTEALRAASWWAHGRNYPEEKLLGAWRGHLFNDFHDILPGSCVEPAERDALELYGKVEAEARSLRLDAAAALARMCGLRATIPLTVLNANPALTRVPVEAEFMIEHRPKWTGLWHTRVLDSAGREVPSQEEQPEALLPFNGWRRKTVFMADLPPVGASFFAVEPIKGPASDAHKSPAAATRAAHRLEQPTEGLPFLALLVDDDGDSWGTDHWSYRDVEDVFRPQAPGLIVECGPVRTVAEHRLAARRSRIMVRLISYPDWPVVDLRLRIHWNETGKRLKLAFPTGLNAPELVCEVPGGIVMRPGDGQEHVHGRWCLAEGSGKRRPMAFGIAHAGLHGLDFKNGEIRLSVLRASAYCHEQGFKIGARPERKYADIGVHDIRLALLTGAPMDVRAALPGLADWLAAPPAVYAHLPFGEYGASGTPPALNKKQPVPMIRIVPTHIRLLALKRSRDGEALIVRLQETIGQSTKSNMTLAAAPDSGRAAVSASLSFEPFEIKTLRIDSRGGWKSVRLIEEI